MLQSTCNNVFGPAWYSQAVLAICCPTLDKILFWLTVRDLQQQNSVAKTDSRL